MKRVIDDKLENGSLKIKTDKLTIVSGNLWDSRKAELMVNRGS